MDHSHAECHWIPLRRSPCPPPGNMGFSRMSLDSAKSLINDYNQAAVENGDLS